MFLENNRFRRAMAVIYWLFKQSTWGKVSDKMPTAIVGYFFFFFAIYSSKMFQTMKKKGCPVLGLEPKELFA